MEQRLSEADKARGEWEERAMREVKQAALEVQAQGSSDDQEATKVLEVCLSCLKINLRKVLEVCLSFLR